MDDVDDALAMGEERVAEMLLDRELKAAKKEKATAKKLLAILRRRAAIAEETSIDDDLPSLASAAKRIGEAAAHPDASAADRDAYAFALLMAGKTATARKVGSTDPVVVAAIAYATKPSPAKRDALMAAGRKGSERAVRLLVQRDETVSAEAMALFEARRKKGAKQPRGVQDGLARIARVQKRFGDDSLVEPALWALNHEAKQAKDFAVSAEACAKLDAILSKRRGDKADEERRAVLGDLINAFIALGRFDDAEATMRRLDELLPRFPVPVPYHLTWAKIARARGDWKEYVARHEAAVKQWEASEHPGYGRNGSNTDLARSWLQQAKEERVRSRSKG
jgi:hypothetical protein